MKDFNTINYITKIFYNLNLNIQSIEYSQKKESIKTSFEVDSHTTLNELLSEIKRAPNILKVTRVFPIRLMIYYILYLTSLSVITSILFFIHFFDFNNTEKSIVLQ